MQNRISNFSRGLISSVFVIFVILAFLPVFTTHAQTQPTDTYKVLAPLPGTTAGACNEPGDPGCKTSLQRYLPGIFNLAIGVSAAFVLLNLVFGGFQWMSSDAFTKKEEGKKRIENSLKGILLVAGAYIILFTINPQLLDVKLDIESIEVPSSAAPTPSGTGGTVLTPAQIAESDAIRASLQTEGVYTYAPPCARGQTRGCVNLNGLQETAKDGLVVLRQEVRSNITITGGTESGHSATGGHPTGNSVDLRPDTQLNAYLDAVNPTEGQKVFRTINGKVVEFTYEVTGGNAAGTSSGNHWHVRFQSGL